MYIGTTLYHWVKINTQGFLCISDTLEWIPLQAGISSRLHCLDDFLMADSEDCDCNFKLLTEVCKALGICLTVKKIDRGPTTPITFLKILLDSKAMTMHLQKEDSEYHCRMAPEKDAKKKEGISIASSCHQSGFTRKDISEKNDRLFP